VYKDARGEMVIALRGGAMCVGRDRAGVLKQPQPQLGLVRSVCQGRHLAESWWSSRALLSGSIVSATRISCMTVSPTGIWIDWGCFSALGAIKMC
jgi:hypothetical protein